MTDHEWFLLAKDGADAGWRRIWTDVIEKEAANSVSAGLMKKYSVTPGDLMGMLYEEMIGRGKISLYRDDGGSFQGWLRKYVRGFIRTSDPAPHGEISIDAADSGDGSGGGSGQRREGIEIPVHDRGAVRNETWNMTHLCFKDLWNSGPLRAYVMLLKTRFHLSSVEIAEMLGVSSAANVDQIFSRAVKFMRQAWARNEKNGAGAAFK